MIFTENHRYKPLNFYSTVFGKIHMGNEPKKRRFVPLISMGQGAFFLPSSYVYFDKKLYGIGLQKSSSRCTPHVFSIQGELRFCAASMCNFPLYSYGKCSDFLAQVVSVFSDKKYRYKKRFLYYVFASKLQARFG
jgi:hypothetical protein